MLQLPSIGCDVTGREQWALKDRLLWFEADIVKRPYLRHCYCDFDILYIK